MAETESEKAKQIVVVMVGPPGSGKTTFCDRVMQSPRRPWSHVCQATVNNGDAGTMAEWLNMARNSLTEGKSVFIDKYNINKEQRSEFIQLGSPEVEVHAVVLEIPNQVCINRLVTRTGHIGSLQRTGATLSVIEILEQKKLPEVEEGFSRIMFCYNETDVENAVDIYNMLDPKDTLPSGCFGLQDSDSKINAPPASLESSSSYTTPQTNKRTTTVRDSPSADNVPTLAFPSVSTEDYNFDPVRASDVIIKKVEEFLPKHGTARLILVALSEESEILPLVKTKASQKKIDSKRFFTYVGDITKLRSKGGLRCNVIANPANSELKPGGEGVNGAIFKAAGPDLEAATRECCPIISPLSPGQAVPVKLPSTCPLYSEEGITHVIHVLGPNMDPDQPSSICNFYSMSCDILGEAYKSLFDTFLSLLQVQPPRSPKRLKQTKGSDSAVLPGGFMVETEAKKAKQIVLLLIGLPGSGKSTFCDNLMQFPCRPWSLVSRTTVNDGKDGTTAEWVNMARNSLTEGKSVFIDKFNINKEQRSEFIKLGSPKVHAVVLELPALVCINRLVTKIGYVGHLQRERATSSYNGNMLRKKELPEVEEGFSRILFCYNDTDVENAVNLYNMLGPKETLPSGCFGLRLRDPNSKINAPPGSIESSSSNKRTRDWPTLAFPSISTEDYKFDPVKASDVIIKKVEEFLRYHGTARFILVASSHESKILSLVKTKASHKNIDSARFFTHVGDITKLRSGGLHCSVIANPANWELKPGGEGVNGAIFMAAGPDLVAATRKRCGNIIVPGQAVSVALPGSSSNRANTTPEANEKITKTQVSPTKLSSTENVPTLAFPSLSTADFQFDLEKASDIIVEKVEEFLPKIGAARLALVDLSHGSKILSLVKAKASQKNIDSARFFTFVGDITKLHSKGGLHCNVIVNAAN